MKENSSDAKNLGAVIADLISKGKLNKLETAFRNNPELMKHVRDYWNAHNQYKQAHNKFMDTMDKICKKQSCDTNLNNPV